jgi:hypothetical protein
MSAGARFCALHWVGSSTCDAGEIADRLVERTALAERRRYLPVIARLCVHKGNAP